MREIKITNEVVNNDWGETSLKLYGRDRDGNSHSITVEDYNSSFYGPTDQVLEIQDGIMSNDEVLEINHETNVEGIHGDSMSEVVVKSPYDQKTLTESYDGVDWYGSDLFLDGQFRIESELYTGIGVEGAGTSRCLEDLEMVDMDGPAPKICMLDLETDDRGEFVTDGSRKILSIVASDSYSEEVVAFFHTGPDREIQDCFPSGRPENVDRLEYTTTERAMLEKFRDYIQVTDPDLLSGWNAEDFDLPYLYRRFEELNLDPASLSREDYAKDHGPRGVSFSGRTNYDLLAAYKRSKQYELDSYKLDAVAAEELDDAKIDHTGLGYWDMWAENPELLVNYNAQDVLLCDRLNDELGVIAFWEAVRDEVGLDFEDTKANNNVIETLARRDLHEHGIVGPATDYSREQGDYAGGYVFDPYTGSAHNVLAIDLASLYPYTIFMSNVSPETKVTEDEASILERAGIPVCHAPNGAFFRLDRDGVFKRLVDKAISLKAEYKKLRNAATPGTPEHDKFAEKYNVAKTITNAVYGVSGWEKFFLYDEEVAEAITLLGQECIKRTARYVNEETIGEVIYGDTDSCYIELPNSWNEEDCIEWGEKICSALNDEVYPEFAESFGIPAEDNKWEIEPEALGTFFQAGKKKRYAFKAVWEEGTYLETPEYSVKGFGSKRSDTSILTTKTEKKLFRLILDGADESEIMELISDAADQIDPVDADLDLIGIPGGIGKELEDYKIESAHIRGARYMNTMSGTDIGINSKPKRVYLQETICLGEGEDAEMVDVLSFEDLSLLPAEYKDDLKIDAGAMNNKLIEKPLGDILSAVGVDSKAAIKGQTQSGLAAYL